MCACPEPQGGVADGSQNPVQCGWADTHGRAFRRHGPLVWRDPVTVRRKGEWTSCPAAQHAPGSVGASGRSGPRRTSVLWLQGNRARPGPRRSPGAPLPAGVPYWTRAPPIPRGSPGPRGLPQRRETSASAGLALSHI